MSVQERHLVFYGTKILDETLRKLLKIPDKTSTYDYFEAIEKETGQVTSIYAMKEGDFIIESNESEYQYIGFIMDTAFPENGEGLKNDYDLKVLSVNYNKKFRAKLKILGLPDLKPEIRIFTLYH